MSPPEQQASAQEAPKITVEQHPDQPAVPEKDTETSKVPNEEDKEQGSQNGDSDVTTKDSVEATSHDANSEQTAAESVSREDGDLIYLGDSTREDVIRQDRKGKMPALQTSSADPRSPDETTPTRKSAPRNLLVDLAPPVPPKDDGLSPPTTPGLEKLQELRISSQPTSDTEEAEKASIDERSGDVEENADPDSRSEITSIMTQFQEGMGGPGEEEIMSPRLDFAGPILGSPSHPPRKSSLEPLHQTPSRDSFQQALSSPPPPRSSSLYSPAGPSNASIRSLQLQEHDRTTSPRPASQIFKPPPPEPDPEPDLPFDFHRFLEQLRHRTADPVAKFLRSFLLEFGKKSWMVHEQVKIISDFLAFIAKKMGQCEVWRTVSDAEFDNAREGMEKLVMNRLYSQTFSPEIPPPEYVRRGRREEYLTGRRGQHQEDVERDEVLAQKVRIYGWVKEEHLDIKPIGDKGRKFMKLAQAELLKIQNYRAPRDKVICILNCCKVIFGFLRDSKSDQSADSFVPLLIYVVLQANPDHLVSNVQYILRFRNQEKLGGEAGYYISSLMGAVQFIENLDRTSLTVSDTEFESHVEAAVKEIAERHTHADEKANRLLQSPSKGSRRPPSPGIPFSEKAALSRPEVTARHSLEGERAPRRSTSTRESKESEKNDGGEENAAVAGLLRTIQRPLSSIGRIFSDTDTHATSAPSTPPNHGGYPGQNQHRNLTPQPPHPQRLPAPQRRSSDNPRRSTEQQHQFVQRAAAEDAAVRQASVEAEEVRRVQRREFETVVETLAGMFPDLDREIIRDVVRGQDGNVGLAVDACLALNST